MVSDLITFISHKIDYAAGAFVYFLYTLFFQKRNIMKSVGAFVIGMLCAIYLSPQIIKWTSLEVEFVSFCVGALGMKITEAVLHIDYNAIAQRQAEKYIKLPEESNDNTHN